MLKEHIHAGQSVTTKGRRGVFIVKEVFPLYSQVHLFMIQNRGLRLAITVPFEDIRIANKAELEEWSKSL